MLYQIKRLIAKWRGKRALKVSFIPNDAMTLAEFERGCDILGVDPDDVFTKGEEALAGLPGVKPRDAKEFMAIVYQNPRAIPVEKLPFRAQQDLLAQAAGVFFLYSSPKYAALMRELRRSANGLTSQSRRERRLNLLRKVWPGTVRSNGTTSAAS